MGEIDFFQEQGKSKSLQRKELILPFKTASKYLEATYFILQTSEV